MREKLFELVKDRTISLDYALRLSLLLPLEKGGGDVHASWEY